MSFMFLHPAFFVWMGPPVLALFYLWMTQKTSGHSVFSPETLKRLRAPAVTMGLQGRNALFLAASILLITAMAEPVAVDEDTVTSARANVLLAIDISSQNVEALERSKGAALSLLSGLEGANVGALAYDQIVYRIAPLSRDTMSVAALIRGLSPEAIHPPLGDPVGMVEALRKTAKGNDAVIAVLISGKPLPPIERYEGMTVIGMDDRVSAVSVLEAIKSEQIRNRLSPHIPLFFYPLGLAMLLIGLALSSMSKRRSVPLAAVLLVWVLDPVQSNAGILDFRILNEAKASYGNGEYARSAELFKQYQQNHDTPQVRYNRANALYKAGDYAQARMWYERVHTADPILRERTRYNLAQTVENLKQTEPQSDIESSEKKGAADNAKRVKSTNTPNARKTRLYRIF